MSNELTDSILTKAVGVTAEASKMSSSASCSKAASPSNAGDKKGKQTNKVEASDSRVKGYFACAEAFFAIS